MKFVSGALATILPVLLVRGDPQTPTTTEMDPSGFEYDAFLPMPPAPGSDAVFPDSWRRYFKQQEQYEEGLELTSSSSSPPPPPLRDHDAAGAYKVLVLLLKFADHDKALLPPKEKLLTLYNEYIDFDPLQNLERESGNEVNPTGSVSQVFSINSHGALNIQAVVTDWIELDFDEKHYASDEQGVGEYGKGASQFEEGIAEALEKLAATGFDFSQFSYDSEKEDQMEGFGVIHSGHGAEFGGPGKEFRVWSIKGSGIDWTVPGHGIVNKYYTTAVFYNRPPTNSSQKQFMRFGTACHEIGHSLGLPDLYDTSFAGKGLGNYDFMATGNYGFDKSGWYPSNLSAYSKLQMGWAKAEVITQSGVYTNQAGISQVYKITHGFPQGKKPEYLLIENRQPIGYDSAMTGGGIAIYHVDEYRQKQNAPGYPGMDLISGKSFPENKKHYRVALLASDGLYGLEEGTSKAKGGDLLWSNSSALTELGFSSNDGGDDNVWPNTEKYQKGKVAETGVKIYNFSSSGTTMTFSVDIMTSKQATHLRAQTIEREVS